MTNRAVGSLICSQLIFIGSLLVCFAINPDIVLENRALSLYGTELKTIIPFAAGNLLMAFFIVKAARQLPKNIAANHLLSRGLLVLAVLLLGSLATPFTVNVWFRYFHVVFSFSLFIMEFSLGLWLVIKAREDLLDSILFAVLSTGFLLSFLSLDEVNILQLLVVGQLMAVCGFALLLTRAVSRIERIDT